MLLRNLLLFLVLGSSWGSLVEFLCAVGEACPLYVYKRGMPATPGFRISDIACGTSASGALYLATSPFVLEYNMPAVVDATLTIGGLTICLSLNDQLDPNYSVAWGHVKLMGPDSLGTPFPCYFGSYCVPVIPGTRLSSTPSVLYYSSTLGVCSTTLDGPMYGLHNDPPVTVLPSVASPWTFATFGIVDSTLDVVTDLTLCWAASPVLSNSFPTVLGTLRLTGPLVRSLAEVCYMGTDCSISLAGQLSTSSLIISDSDFALCDSIWAPIFWHGSVSRPVYSSGAYSFGAVTGTNGIPVNERGLCYGAGTLPDAGNRVRLGVISMVGPTDQDVQYVCVSGSSCVIEIEGVFDSSVVSSVSVRSGSCAGALVDFEPVPLSNTFNPAVAPVVGSSLLTSQSYTIGAIGLSDFTALTMVVCWQNHLAGSLISAGFLTIQAPWQVPALFSCSLGLNCEILLNVSGLTAITPASPSTVSFVEYVVGVDLDPCVNGHVVVSGSNGTVGNLGSEFLIPMNKALDPAKDGHALCWRFDSSGRLVQISQFEIFGPEKIGALSCALGDACDIVLGAYIGATSGTNRLFLMPSDAACEAANSRTKMPSLWGDASFQNPTVLSDASTGTFSFSAIFGGPSSYPAVYSICYAANPNRHRSAVLGALSIENPFTVTVPVTCVEGAACIIQISRSAGSLSASSLLALSRGLSDCSDLTYPSSYTSQTSLAGGVQTFSLPSLSAFLVGPDTFVCYYVGGAMNIATTVVNGVRLTTSPFQCARGAGACTVAITPEASIISQAVFISQGVADCTVSEPALTGAGNAVVWSVIGTGGGGAAISASSGIARTMTHPDTPRFAVCFTSSIVTQYTVVGVLELVGPTESQALVCVVGAACSLQLSGTWGSGSPGVVVIPYVDFAAASASNPCQSALASKVTLFPGITFPVSQSATPGVFDLGVMRSTADSYQFSLCWIYDLSDGTADYVPAGSFTLKGAKFSTDSPLRCYSTLPCIMTVPIQGYSAPAVESVALLVNGTCGAPASQFAKINGPQRILVAPPESGATTGLVTFNFGVLLSTLLDPINVCWGPTAAAPYISATRVEDAPVPVGIIHLIPVNL